MRVTCAKSGLLVSDGCKPFVKELRFPRLLLLVAVLADVTRAQLATSPVGLESVQVASALELQDAVEAGAKYIMISNHLDLTDLNPAFSASSDYEEILAIWPSTKAIVGNCEGIPPPPLPPTEQPPLEDVTGRQCVLTTSSNFTIIASDPTQKLWLDSLYFRQIGRDVNVFVSSLQDVPTEWYITSTTFQGNQLASGFSLWIENVGKAFLQDCTIADRVSDYGPAMVVQGPVAIINSTITRCATINVKEGAISIDSFSAAVLLHNVASVSNPGNLLSTYQGRPVYSDDAGVEVIDYETGEVIPGQPFAIADVPPGRFLTLEDVWITNTLQAVQSAFPLASVSLPPPVDLPTTAPSLPAAPPDDDGSGVIVPPPLSEFPAATPGAPSPGAGADAAGLGPSSASAGTLGVATGGEAGGDGGVAGWVWPVVGVAAGCLALVALMVAAFLVWNHRKTATERRVPGGHPSQAIQSGGSAVGSFGSHPCPMGGSGGTPNWMQGQSPNMHHMHLSLESQPSGSAYSGIAGPYSQAGGGNGYHPGNVACAGFASQRADAPWQVPTCGMKAMSPPPGIHETEVVPNAYGRAEHGQEAEPGFVQGSGDAVVPADAPAAGASAVPEGRPSGAAPGAERMQPPTRPDARGAREAVGGAMATREGKRELPKGDAESWRSWLRSGSGAAIDRGPAGAGGAAPPTGPGNGGSGGTGAGAAGGRPVAALHVAAGPQPEAPPEGAAGGSALLPPPPVYGAKGPAPGRGDTSDVTLEPRFVGPVVAVVTGDETFTPGQHPQARP